MAARVLPNPDLLFLDEPFEGVDAVTSRVIRDLLAGFVGPRIDRFSHVARAGDRRTALHARGHHRQGKLVEQASLETIRQGGTLEDCFLQKAGAEPEARASSTGSRRPRRELAALAGLCLAALAAAAQSVAARRRASTPC